MSHNNDEDIITVSILPLKYIVDEITGKSLAVNVLVPPGSSPETYEPTPDQVIRMKDSRLIFSTGLLDFEKALSDKIARSGGLEIIPLDKEIDIIFGEHHGSAGPAHGHSHGADPHIWMSVLNLKMMAATVVDALTAIYPDSLHYHVNYDRLLERLDRVDAHISALIADSGITSFAIYHPALTYYARDYGLQQIALEEHGKEPSVETLRNVITRVRAQGIGKVLYQREFSRTVVETIARDMQAAVVEIDPLAYDVPQNIRTITGIIVQ